MLYLVLDITNAGDGFESGGYYKSLERAKKRLAYCEKHFTDPDCDSWRIVPIKSPNITAPID